VLEVWFDYEPGEKEFYKGFVMMSIESAIELRRWHRLNSYKINSLIEAISDNLGIRPIE
jgi:hypothetical protein